MTLHLYFPHFMTDFGAVQLIDMCAVFCIFCFHRANWHSSATLTEVFPCFFFSCKANARV